MKHAIFFTAIVAFGTAFPIGLITGVLINKSLVASKVAQAEIDAAKGKEAVAQAETLQKQSEQLQNKNVQLSQELSFTKTQAANEIQLLQKEKSDTIAGQKQTFEKQNATLNEQEKEIKRLLAICRKNGIETNPEKAESPSSIIAQSFSGNLEVGQIAYVAGENRLIAKQVVDENNVICKLIETKPSVVNVNGLSVGMTPELSETIWLTNFDTTGLVDGKIVKCNRPLKVSGTKTYHTNLGYKTVFLLEPYQIE